MTAVTYEISFGLTRTISSARLALVMATDVVILETHFEKAPAKSARDFSILLALEKGYSSTIRRLDGGYLVVASDNRAIMFRRQ